ncbi:hypothetical protein [Aliivibrio fischeri]|uniref:Uncharacterized protein n=1 Tax=Aliivibrio fischeri TaxID=668 RepID=A0A510UL54_ALIFS|nr:hypothetical protein [Aliivibrio fischeri]GEK15383.1 hypothetical protein AFI02nite_34190 [Aliivibrio fischeri]
MLQFMKKWYQAFKEDKAVRLAKESQFKSYLNVTVQDDENISTRFVDALSAASDEHYEECCRRGYH